jgi:hypothetical protein
VEVIHPIGTSGRTRAVTAIGMSLAFTWAGCMALTTQQAPPAPAPSQPVPLGAEARDLLEAVKAHGLESSRNVVTVYQGQR